MTQDTFISLLKNPDSIRPEHLDELKTMSVQYPFFAQAQILLAKAYSLQNDLQTVSQSEKAALYCADRKSLYYILHPDKQHLTKPLRIERETAHTGDYFAMIDKISTQSEDPKQSLKSLAERLKAARESIQKPENISKPKVQKQMPEKPLPVEQKTEARVNVPDYFEELIPQRIISEELAKKLIKEKKYAEAIGILNELNLINPKKSVYFVDQIRFLEKILVNKNK
jgi:hypothetical protein